MTTATRTAIVAATIAVFVTSGCARHVVVDPKTVADMNDSDWRIQERRATPAPSPEVPSDVAPSAPPPPLPTRLKLRPPEAGTAPDRYGIPVGLYDYDPMLRSYLQMAEARASSHRAVGGAVIAMGVVMGVLSGVLFLKAAQNADLARSARSSGQQVEDPSGTQYTIGVIDGAFALGLLVAGIVEVASGTDTRALQRYAGETYERPQAP